MNLVCSSCIRSFPTDRMHVLPGWVEAPDAPGHFVITFRCHACYPAAIDDTARRVAAWDDATAADMAQFIDLWDLRDFLPELADANDREAATTLVQIVQASDGKALLPRVVPDPGIVEEAGFLERISIFATRMPRRALVIWCLWLVYLIFQCGYMTPEPWRPPGWATCAVTLLLPRVFEASFRTLTEHLSGRGVWIPTLVVAVNVLAPGSVRAAPWFALPMIAAMGLVVGMIFWTYSSAVFWSDKVGVEDEED